MAVLVTGAAGFIGSHLCTRLIELGRFVVALDNFDNFYNPQIKRRNILQLLYKDNFNLIKGDIRDLACLENIFNKHKIDTIVHLAAKAGVRGSIEKPIIYSDVNINGTMSLLKAAEKYGVDKFIFASSSSVYGNNKKIPFSEGDRVDFPISPYAATKKAGELLCHTYHHLYGLNVSCLRFFTVYGPRQRPDLAICKFAQLIEQKKPIPVFGDGSMMRDFTYIGDIINGVCAAVEKCVGYEIYNLGNSVPVRVDHVIVELERALGKKAEIKHFPVQPGDVIRTCADIEKAEKRLNYNPQTKFSTGLKNFVRWLRVNKTSFRL